MHKFIDLVQSNQSFLAKRTLHYAKLHGYSQYTSTLEEAWMSSITGLSDALIEAVRQDAAIPEIEIDCDFSNNPISAFGVLEAQRHRQRGVSLEMFLSLMKYYRQSYLDLVDESVEETDGLRQYRLWIIRFFDHNEIAYIHEWTSKSKKSLIWELQTMGLTLTNEKNKYLTIFESFPNPAIVVDNEHNCINLNFAAQKLLYKSSLSPGSAYYSNTQKYPTIEEVLPWLKAEYLAFCSSDMSEFSTEKEFDSPLQGKRNLVVRFRRMLDISGKFDDIVILFSDVTDIKTIESKLIQMSYHDQLTGLYNRAYMEEELIRLAAGGYNPVGFISIDVDGLKLVNDNLGHAAGDSLLVHVSHILKKSARKNDTVIRMGGDEFGVLMPSCSEETAHKVCDRIRDKMTAYNKMNASLPISMSIGWSIGNILYSSNFTEIIKQADTRMYTEKQTNHSVFAQTFKDWLLNTETFPHKTVRQSVSR